MARLTLARAAYARHEGALAPSGAPGAELCEALAGYIGAHLRESLDGVAPSEIGAHFVCTTMIDVAFASGALDWAQLRRGIGAASGFVPDTLVNAYECASWGYALRHALRQPRRRGQVLITIVDVNVLNLRYWVHSPHWGASGFGIASVLLRCADDGAEDLMVGCAKTHSTVAELGIAMREVAARRPGLKLAKPFFPRAITEMLERQVAGAEHLQDLHPQVGHCFGADPWLALIVEVQRAGAADRYLATSLALNGYWAMAEVALAADGRFRAEGLPS